ncbi:hypothetical protein [Tenacibaculum discolor]|uniref:hypothetical protein n=1 Tax=Tenacibaculum discolor TaxID=361581 RepID=UPI00159BE137|nr:hypothetical protein [Tenacibaculum discolor]
MVKWNYSLLIGVLILISNKLVDYEHTVIKLMILIVGICFTGYGVCKGLKNR